MSYLDDLLNDHLQDWDDDMSDMTDHEQDAWDYHCADLPKQTKTKRIWVCEICGRSHPAWHHSCWHCKPTGYKIKR